MEQLRVIPVQLAAIRSDILAAESQVIEFLGVLVWISTGNIDVTQHGDPIDQYRSLLLSAVAAKCQELDCTYVSI